MVSGDDLMSDLGPTPEPEREPEAEVEPDNQAESEQSRDPDPQDEQDEQAEQAEQQQTEPVGLSQAAAERLDALAADLESCVAIRQCQERLATSITDSDCVDEQAAAEQLAERRIAFLRSRRGERSNKKN